MIGDFATVLKAQDGSVRIRYNDEIWRAKSQESLVEGQKVLIRDVEGLLWRYHHYCLPVAQAGSKLRKQVNLSEEDDGKRQGQSSKTKIGIITMLIIGRLKSYYEGVYPVFFLALAALTYGLTAAAGGSGFLAVYIAGLTAGNSDFIYKKSLLRFFDGLAWLSQITMFLTLGLLVFPSRIIPVVLAGLACSAFLMFVARSAGVFLSLLLARLQWREKVLVSWVGLRGSVPIVLATFPLLAGVTGSEAIFNIVFFIVLT